MKLPGRPNVVLVVFIILGSVLASAACAGNPGQKERYTLADIIDYAVKNNPRLRISDKDIVAEAYGIDTAKAERMPRIDFGSGATRYRYAAPLTPIVINPPIGPGTDFPDFERNIYDVGGYFRFPIFKGGRLVRGVQVAEMKRSVAQDNYSTTKQELVYNLTSVFYKILQLEKLLQANDATVRQLEAHKRNVEVFLKTGTAPKLDLLKTDVELSHARERRLLVKNSLESTYELLKTLMGIDDMSSSITIGPEPRRKEDAVAPALDESIQRAFSQRPEYIAVMKKKKISEEKVKIAWGKRLPDVYAAGEYSGRSGDSLAFKENWSFGLKMILPVFDGGLIQSEIDRERNELEKVKEEERLLKIAITREVRDAYLGIANAEERIEVTEKAIASAKESLRVELLKYDSGAGMNTDVIDAQTALLRAETDFCQALYDKEVALALLRKATGEGRGDLQ
ncbi:MAG TPA: TolC family protein [Syntrophorhabdaceae bacterium]|nr:TolC family protein [Syntrophorhabdaceae bacterium]